MSVTRDEVLRVAWLARLDLDESDLDDLTARMNRILEHVDRMREADAAGLPTAPDSAPAGLVLADDVQGEMLSTEEALSNAPDSSREHFRVPASLPDPS